MSFLTTNTSTSVFLGSDANTHDSLYIDRTNQPTTTPHSLSFFENQDDIFDTIAEAKRAIKETGVDEYIFLSPGQSCESLTTTLNISTSPLSNRHIPPIKPLPTNTVKHYDITTQTTWQYIYALLTSDAYAPATHDTIDPQLIKLFVEDYHREQHYTSTTQPDTHFTLEQLLTSFSSFLSTGNTPEAKILQNTLNHILDTHPFGIPPGNKSISQQLTNTHSRCIHLSTQAPETREAYIWIARLNHMLRGALTSTNRTTIVLPHMNPLLEALSKLPQGLNYFQNFLHHCALNNISVHCCISNKTNLTATFDIHELHNQFGYIRIYDHCTALQESLGIPTTHTEFLHESTPEHAETASVFVTHTQFNREFHKLYGTRSMDEGELYPSTSNTA